jgi:hypothetical protein
MPVSYLKHGTPEWIRTTDLLLRRLPLSLLINNLLSSKPHSFTDFLDISTPFVAYWWGIWWGSHTMSHNCLENAFV